MPQVTLLKPRTFRLGQTEFVKGETVDVDLLTLARCREYPDRFEIRDGDVKQKDVQAAIVTQREVVAPTKSSEKPDDPEKVMRDIKVAYMNLDPDESSNFTKNGKADARALSKMVGYTVTAAERDDALEDDPDEQEAPVASAAGPVTPDDAPKRLKLGKTPTTSEDSGEEL
jgi:hypothetical protein